MSSLIRALLAGSAPRGFCALAQNAARDAVAADACGPGDL